ncbi:MAG: phosphoribosylamine--glycine ligase [Bacteroidales bacterium]|nr:phosphoribosylamine--glycine ligase [Bacteroidales bacterium]
MRVLIIGSGGRESAFAWSISKSPMLEALCCAPGNPGTAKLAKNLEIDIKDFNAIKQAVLENRIGLVIVGPEEPLVNGLGDFFKQDDQLKNLLFVGPDRLGAQLEGSKEFAKNFMQKWSIPTASYRSFDKSSVGEAEKFLETLKAPYVLKADGLAAGKGVVILDNIENARRELHSMLEGKFGKAGDKVVIEEYLHGIELSVFVLTDGNDYLILPEAKDYKRIGDGDTGLNTGGMGAVSPVPFAGELFMKKVEERIVKPTIEGLKRDGIKYTGFIFVGLMNCDGEPYVIEYNVRMGDPETEAVLPRIESDLLAHLTAAARGELGAEVIIKDKRQAMTLVTVSGGYPEEYGKGFTIDGLEELKEVNIFHAGTKSLDGKTVTAGGRVLAITALSTDIESCRNILYREISSVKYDGIYYRKDIGLDLLNY